MHDLIQGLAEETGCLATTQCPCSTQLLHVAYAQHELTGGSTDAALAWLETGGAASIDKLLQQATGQQATARQQQHA